MNCTISTFFLKFILLCNWSIIKVSDFGSIYCTIQSIPLGLFDLLGILKAVVHLNYVGLYRNVGTAIFSSSKQVSPIEDLSSYSFIGRPSLTSASTLGATPSSLDEDASTFVLYIVRSRRRIEKI